MATSVSNRGMENGFRPQSATSKNNRKIFLDSFVVLPRSRFKESSSGLKIAVIREGEGEKLTQGKPVKVNYTGWLETGKKFDSSVGKGQPFEFILGAGKVIKGWEEGLAGIKPGERRQLIIPAKLAYGNRRAGKIPPGATLIFNVEAVSVGNSSPNSKGTHSITA